MTTKTELVDSIHAALHSYTGVQEQVTWLTSAIDASTTTIPVNGADTVMRGVVEIDEELLYVNSTDAANLILAPFGRGFRGSTAATHALNAQVTFDPAFPRREIIKTINRVIESLFPHLYQHKTEDITYVSTTVAQPVASDVESVLGVLGQYPGDPADYWTPIVRWSYDANTPDGKVLNLHEQYAPGTLIRVVYRARFGELTTDFATSGIPESYEDLLLYGVTAQMVRFLEPGRLQLPTVENVSRSQVVNSGDAGRTANQLYAMFQARLAEERRSLLEMNPPTINFLSR